MKKHALIFWLACLLTSFGSFANTVIVKGTIVYSGGGVAVGKTVWISSLPSSNTAGCLVTDSVKTNPNGYFIDTLACNTDIKKVVVSTRNCNGELLQKILEVPATGTISVEFVLNCSLQLCRPDFSYQRVNSSDLIIYFNSKESMTGAQDSIIRRVWTFGDGTANEGNAIEIKKEYKQQGNYQVCLKILTKSGCTQTVCKTITVGQNSQPTCKAQFKWEPIPASESNRAGFQFFSSLITATPDSIMARTWIFGDGDTLRGNEPNPKHAYRQPGKYEVCLIIKTKSGCENRQCQLLVVEWLKCKPIVRSELLPRTNTGFPVRFHHVANTTNDSIISRIWQFGDGVTLQENIPNPLHEYKQPGKYIACVIVKTKNGCIDSACLPIHILAPVATGCQAAFSFEAKELTAYFTSKPSVIAPNDSIVKRIWRLSDGRTVEGNEPAIRHQFQRPGTYEVCLVIFTSRGCESRYCKQVIIPPTTNQQLRCEAKFTIARRDGNRVQFDSKASAAYATGDSIVSRVWDFGNGTVLRGNVINPIADYPPFGSKFNVCLSIRTAKGCESKFCLLVEARHTQSPNDSTKVWLVRHFPNPVQKTLYAVIFSPRDNEQVEIAVLDVYGVIKSTLKVVVPKGHSTHNINTSALLAGPYMLRVRTTNGVQSRNFYKVN